MQIPEEIEGESNEPAMFVDRIKLALVEQNIKEMILMTVRRWPESGPRPVPWKDECCKSLKVADMSTTTRNERQTTLFT